MYAFIEITIVLDNRWISIQRLSLSDFRINTCIIRLVVILTLYKYPVKDHASACREMSIVSKIFEKFHKPLLLPLK